MQPLCRNPADAWGYIPTSTVAIGDDATSLVRDNLSRVGTLPGPQSILHCILKCASKRYRDNNEAAYRESMCISVRESLISVYQEQIPKSKIDACRLAYSSVPIELVYALAKDLDLDIVVLNSNLDAEYWISMSNSRWVCLAKFSDHAYEPLLRDNQWLWLSKPEFVTRDPISSPLNPSLRDTYPLTANNDFESELLTDLYSRSTDPVYVDVIKQFYAYAQDPDSLDSLSDAILYLPNVQMLVPGFRDWTQLENIVRGLPLYLGLDLVDNEKERNPELYETNRDLYVDFIKNPDTPALVKRYAQKLFVTAHRYLARYSQKILDYLLNHPDPKTLVRTYMKETGKDQLQDFFFRLYVDDLVDRDLTLGDRVSMALSARYRDPEYRHAIYTLAEMCSVNESCLDDMVYTISSKHPDASIQSIVDMIPKYLPRSKIRKPMDPIFKSVVSILRTKSKLNRKEQKILDMIEKQEQWYLESLLDDFHRDTGKKTAKDFLEYLVRYL